MSPHQGSKHCKHNAGKLLGAIAKIKELSITCDEIGDQGHGASSEPYSYETAYAPVERQSAIAVNDCGRCVVAEEVLDEDGNPYERPLWKCTEEYKHPTEDEVACIASKPCLNSLCNRCVRVSKTSTLAVHIYTAHCHRLCIRVTVTTMRSVYLQCMMETLTMVTTGWVIHFHVHQWAVAAANNQGSSCTLPTSAYIPQLAVPGQMASPQSIKP